MKPSFAIVGCGKTGTALGKYLALAGYPAVGVASRRRSSAERLARSLDIALVSCDPWKITAKAEVVFLTTPDDAIQATCETIARHQGFRAGTVVLHCSGAHSSTILSAARACDARIGSMHPLQSFASASLDSNPFAGIVVAVEGDRPAVHEAVRMARDLGAVTMEIRTEAKRLYHAAAVVASNYLVVLMDLSMQLLEAAGIGRSEALDVLKPLVEGTVANIEAFGIPEALTGPIARGDIDTVAAHIREIETRLPEGLSLYQILGNHAVRLAQAKGGISVNTAETLRQLLQLQGGS